MPSQTAGAFLKVAFLSPFPGPILIPNIPWPETLGGTRGVFVWVHHPTGSKIPWFTVLRSRSPGGAAPVLRGSAAGDPELSTVRPRRGATATAAAGCPPQRAAGAGHRGWELATGSGTVIHVAGKMIETQINEIHWSWIKMVEIQINKPLTGVLRTTDSVEDGVTSFKSSDTLEFLKGYPMAAACAGAVYGVHPLRRDVRAPGSIATDGVTG